METPTIQKKRNKLQIYFAIIVVIIGIPVIGILYAYNWYDQAISTTPTESADTYEITVEEGENLTTIADELEQNEVINSKLALQIYLQVNDLDPQIKIGTYQLPKNAILEDIIAILEEGVFESTVTITIKEGTRTEAIAEIIETQLKLSGAEYVFDDEEFLDIALNPDNYEFSEEIQSFLDENKPTGKPLRGFLYPDTYFLTVDMSSIQAVEFLLENFISKYDEANITYSTNNITNLYDALILASIIEKEAALNDDRADISSVFHNRLANGIVLAADSTINFVTDQTSENLNTRLDSVYNTYTNAGLVPTPINNPRVDSIIAASKPNETPYFFFFHDDQGNTYYSETEFEHTTKVCEIRGCF